MKKSCGLFPIAIFLVSLCQGFLLHPKGNSWQSFKNNHLTMSKITFDNFWINTVANFTVCDAPLALPDFVSKSGSKYWNINDISVIRQSDHWSGQHGCFQIVDCLWYLDQSIHFEESICGCCDFANFMQKKRKGRKTLRERGVKTKDKKEKTDKLRKVKTDFNNFWRSTQAEFFAHEYPLNREPDFQSRSGSKYWDDGDGVIRLSDHWVGQFGVKIIVDCHWTIDKKQTIQKEPVSGKCLYENFYSRKRMRWKK